MLMRRGVVAFVSLVAIHAGCAKGMSSGGDGDGDGDDVGQVDAGNRPDAGGGGGIDAGHQDPPDAGGGGGPVTLTHSNSMALEEGTSVACYNGFGNARNSWYRLFDLPAMGITGPLEVSNVTIGIEEADAGDGSQRVTVNLYRLQGEFVVANLNNLLATAKVTVADTTLEMRDVPLTASVPAGSTLVAEIMVPNGQVRGDYFFPGANDDGQTGPTYVRSECGSNQPQDVADLGFPDFHLVLSVDAVEQ